MSSDTIVDELNKGIFFHNTPKQLNSVTDMFIDNMRKIHRIPIKKNTFIENKHNSVDLRVKTSSSVQSYQYPLYVQKMSLPMTEYDVNTIQNNLTYSLPSKYNKVHPYTGTPSYHPNIRNTILTPYIHTFYHK